ncbi:MAG: hypothetical protein ACRCUE_19725 [Bosea sp. (in: a-proteobacteria)]
MRDRHLVRRLLLTIVLSQAMVIQALLVAWSSTQAAAGAASGISSPICSGTRSSGGTEPGQPGTPHDCFSACLAAQMGAPVDLTVLLPHDTVYARMSASRQVALPEIERQLAFSARAPPTLT